MVFQLMRSFHKAALTVLLALFVTACGYEGVRPVEGPVERARNKQGSILGGDGLTTDGLFGGNEDPAGGSGISVNSFLWRASLDTISFVPLSQVDPFGGVIISDWYSPPEAPSERFKLNVYILSRQLRSDGIRVAIYKQQLRGNSWINVQVNDKTATQLENSILKRARQLRISLEQNPEQ